MFGIFIYIRNITHLILNLTKVLFACTHISDIYFNNFRQENQHKGVEIVPTFQAAVELSDRFYKYGEAENVWIMGGQPIYTVS